MFCPRCATENKPEQRYCRHCGLALPAVRLAIEGHVDEAIKKYKNSEDAFGCAFMLLLIGGVSAGISVYFNAWPIAIIGGALGFLLSLILIGVAMSRIGKANKLLSPQEKKNEQDAPALNQAAHAAGAPLPPAPITEELKARPLRPLSVIEDTTLKLKRPE